MLCRRILRQGVGICDDLLQRLFIQREEARELWKRPGLECGHCWCRCQPLVACVSTCDTNLEDQKEKVCFNDRGTNDVGTSRASGK